MSDVVIEMHGVSVRYGKSFHALEDISLQVRSGEKVGLVGGNGAGKTTLLRVAAGIIRPTRGISIRRGSVAPLLALGAGFDPRLSGRSNIFFNGALLGRTRREVNRSIDEIIAFSGLEDFIDAPLRTYSTGMVARLAFSIATTIDADSILLDEIFSVGDAGFRERCEARVRSYAERGSAIVLVSHVAGTIETMCDRVVRLEAGRIVADCSFVPRPSAG